MDLSVVLYGETGRSKVDRGREPRAADLGASGGGGGEKYRECMRNHAAAIGGQAYDGCGEFMPGGEEGTLEALKCAACGCHRNFHRRAGFSSGDPCGPLLLKAAPPPSGFPVFLPPPPHPMPLPFHAIRPPPPPPPPPPQPTAYQVDRSRVGSETPPRPEEAAAASEGPRGAARKRYRTKFTQEQKEKMQAFAEKLGWRIQKHDIVALEEFCVEVGVKRHVLKVWMHNNKNHLSSSSSSSSVAAAAAAAAPKPDATSAPPIRV